MASPQSLLWSLDLLNCATILRSTHLLPRRTILRSLLERSKCLEEYGNAVRCSCLVRAARLAASYSQTDFNPIEKAYIALGLEGSANKLGAGVMKHDVDGSTSVLSNVRHTYITPPGEGFLPRDTAKHHRDWALTVIKDALKKAAVTMSDIDCICFTQGACLIQILW